MSHETIRAAAGDGWSFSAYPSTLSEARSHLRIVPQLITDQTPVRAREIQFEDVVVEPLLDQQSYKLKRLNLNPRAGSPDLSLSLRLNVQ